MTTQPEPGTPAPESLVALGQIVRPHGIRGALKMLAFFDEPEHIAELRSSQLFLDTPAPAIGGDAGNAPRLPLRPVTLERSQPHQNSVILTLTEVADVNAAETLRGARVYCREEDLWPLDEDSFFVFDLVGYKVLDAATAEPLGTVTRVEEGAAHDLLVVEQPAGKTFLFPLVKALIPEVRRAERVLVVTVPPELGLDT